MLSFSAFVYVREQYFMCCQLFILFMYTYRCIYVNIEQSTVLIQNIRRYFGGCLRVGGGCVRGGVC